MRRSDINQGAPPPSGEMVNGTGIVRQLEVLLSQYETLDAPTKAALERAFEHYKRIRPGGFSLKEMGNSLKEAGANFMKGMGQQRESPTAPTPAQNNPPTERPPKPKAPKPPRSAIDPRELTGAIMEACRNAEEACEAAKNRYTYRNQILEVYQQTVSPYLEPFKKLTPHLSYFAGCADPAVYESAKTPLRNRTRALINGLQPEMWGCILNRTAMDRIEEMFRIVQPESSFRFQPEAGTDVKSIYEAYRKRKEQAEDLYQRYEIENGKLDRQIKEATLLWEYVALLRSFLPEVEQIVRTPEDAQSARWAAEIGQSLLQKVRSHACRNEKMRFLWIFPDDERSRSSESIQLDFIAAELDCPGLYFQIQDHYDGLPPLACVIHGYSKSRKE